jgi:prepilin-type N-terminal cleavage/methylation domain-containing protein/prepilin-type processing-associated H-X9-DG protein
MMIIPKRRKIQKRETAFTLVELLVVLAIIALLVGLSMPAFSAMIRRAQSTKCAGNLRSIGTAVSLAATDNNGQYPAINQNAGGSSGVEVYPPGSGATNLIGALGSYGITTDSIKCPTDMNNATCSFTLYGSSYEWNPVFDDESTVTTILYLNANVKIPINSSRVRLCTDFLPIHRNKMNAVYGDGHVISR